MGSKRKSPVQAGPTCVTAGLLVCTHKDCRKGKGWSELVHLAAGTSRAHEVSCQDVCKGPVVGFAIGAEVRWFAKIKSSGARARVAEMVASGQVPSKLAEREARKRRGLVRGQNRMHPLDPARADELAEVRSSL